MCRGEWGTEVDSGHVWRHGGVPDIGVVLISNPDPCLSCSFGASGGLEQQGRSHSLSDKQGLENTGEGRSALDCASVLVLEFSQPSQEGHSVWQDYLHFRHQLQAGGWIPRVTPHL